MTAKQERCLFPECALEYGGRRKPCRGLCRGHYESARRKVTEGVVTWEELEKHGKCLPSLRRGPRSASQWFTDFKNQEDGQ